MSTELEDTVDILIKHNADAELAEIIFYAFHPLTFDIPRDLVQQVRRAAYGLAFYRLGFACLLKSETQKARQYLLGTAMDRTFYRRKKLSDLVLENLDKIQELVTASRDAFNELRVTKYEKKPF